MHIEAGTCTGRATQVIPLQSRSFDPEPLQYAHICTEEPMEDPKIGSVVQKGAMILIMPIIGALIVALWQFGLLNIDGHAMTIIVYLVMLAGVIVAWRSAQ